MRTSRARLAAGGSTTGGSVVPGAPPVFAPALPPEGGCASLPAAGATGCTGVAPPAHVQAPNAAPCASHTITPRLPSLHGHSLCRPGRHSCVVPVGGAPPPSSCAAHASSVGAIRSASSTCR